MYKIFMFFLIVVVAAVLIGANIIFYTYPYGSFGFGQFLCFLFIQVGVNVVFFCLIWALCESFNEKVE